MANSDSKTQPLARGQDCSHSIRGLSANLTLPDYGRVARHPPGTGRRGHNLLRAVYGQRNFIRHDSASRTARFHRT
jgi:hypothetical protein